MKETGFMHDNRWNSVIEKDGKKFRHRVEILLLKDHAVFISKKPDGSGYSIPGGSTEKDVGPATQVLNELHEEAFLDARAVKHMGQHETLYRGSHGYVPGMAVKYDGDITEIYVGRYAGTWRGKVEQCDLDDETRAGEFWSLDSVLDKLKPEHRKAIIKYLTEEQK